MNDGALRGATPWRDGPSCEDELRSVAGLALPPRSCTVLHTCREQQGCITERHPSLYPGRQHPLPRFHHPGAPQLKLTAKEWPCIIASGSCRCSPSHSSPAAVSTTA